jgi:hypothetical protein
MVMFGRDRYVAKPFARNGSLSNSTLLFGLSEVSDWMIWACFRWVRRWKEG